MQVSYSCFAHSRDYTRTNPSRRSDTVYFQSRRRKSPPSLDKIAEGKGSETFVAEQGMMKCEDHSKPIQRPTLTNTIVHDSSALTPACCVDYRMPHRISLLYHNFPGQALAHLGVELRGTAPREAYLFSQVIRQDIQKFSIPILIKQRRICELRILVSR